MLDTGEKNVSCQEPSDAFLTGWASQASFVSPEFAEAVHLPHSLHWVNFQVLYSRCVIEVDGRRWQLGEERRVRDSRIKSDCYDSSFCAIRIVAAKSAWFQFPFHFPPTEHNGARLCFDPHRLYDRPGHVYANPSNTGFHYLPPCLEGPSNLLQGDRK